jgi:tripartite-type tricarboxylate transporter receptor subunit TctC
MRRIVVVVACLLGALFMPQQQARAEYPDHPVRVIIPFTPGGAPDVLLRMVAQKLTEEWGQSVVVENRPGGNTLIGTVAAAKAPSDGYTLLLAADQTFVLNPLLYSNLPYSMQEFEPVILMASIPHMLAVASKVPATNVKELVALAKANPGKLMYGTTGPGTIQRLAVEYFASIVGVQLVQVPYKGANETTTAILAGEIDMTINGMSNILPHIAGGKLRALAISTAQRNRLAPDVPTMQEAGVPGYTSQGAFGLLAPAGTPKEIREKINADVATILARPEVKAALEERSFVIDSLGPAAFARMIADETEKWGKVIRAANIKGD